MPTEDEVPIDADRDRAAYLAKIRSEVVVGPDGVPVRIRVERLDYGFRAASDALDGDPSGFTLVLLPLVPIVGLAGWLRYRKYRTTPWSVYAELPKVPKRLRLILTGRFAIRAEAERAAERLAANVSTLGVAAVPDSLPD